MTWYYPGKENGTSGNLLNFGKFGQMSLLFLQILTPFSSTVDSSNVIFEFFSRQKLAGLGLGRQNLGQIFILESDMFDTDFGITLAINLAGGGGTPKLAPHSDHSLVLELFEIPNSLYYDTF